MPFTSSGLGINGTPPTFDNSTVAILLDGRPIPAINITDISLINVEKIEIIKGSVSAMYGLNALGGAINIITKKGKKTATNIGGGLGSFDRYIIEGFKGERLSKNLYYHISFQNDRQKDDYKIGNKNLISPSSYQEIILDPASFGSKMLNSSYNKTFINAGMGYTINDNWDLYFETSGYSHKKTKVSGSFYQTKENNNIKNYDLGTSNFSFTVNGKIKKHNISLNSHYINFTDKLRLNDKDSELDEDTKHIYASIKDKYDSKNLNIAAALEYRLNKYEDFYHSFPYENILHKTPAFEDKTLSAFIETNISLVKDRFNINVAIRYDKVRYSSKAQNTLLEPYYFPNNNTCTNNYICPYISFKYDLSKHTSIYFDLGESYNKPLSLDKTGIYHVFSTTSFKEINEVEGPINVITRTHHIGFKNFKEAKNQIINLGIKHHSDLLSFRINSFYSKNKHTTTGTIGVYNKNYTNGLQNINNTDYYIIDLISYLATSDSYNIYGLNLAFSCNLRNSLFNNLTINPYFKSTLLFNNKEAKFLDNKHRDNISNFGFKINYNEKLHCNLNMKIASKRVARNIFKEIYNHNFKPKFDISENNQPYKPIRDIFNNIIREELMHNSYINLPSYGLLNFSCTYSLNKNISLSFFANNILDENYMEVDAHHMPGRNLLVKLKFNFDKLF